MNEQYPNRIISTETEVGLIIASDMPITDEDLRKYKLPGTVIVRQFMANGSRLYVDGATIEYAAPETLGPTEAMHAEISGEIIVFNCLKNMLAAKRIQEFHMHKRVIDEAGTTWGYHENYGIPAETFSSTRMRTLIKSHLATRNIFTGAGYWVQNENLPIGTVVPAQKTHDIVEAESNLTLSNKPLLNLRDEPHADSHKFARLHITSGDANISPWATWMKLGTTSLVLRLHEQADHHIPLTDITFEDPVEAARTVGTDSTLKARLKLANGTHTSAVDIQQKFVELCYTHLDISQLPKEEQKVLEEWSNTIASLKADTRELFCKVDWITREYCMQDFITRKNITSSTDESLIVFDRSWDSLDPEQGRGIRIMRSNGELYNPNLAIHFVHSPPHATRARTRGELVRNTPTRQRDNVRVGWSYFTTADNTRYYMPDPSSVSKVCFSDLI